MKPIATIKKESTAEAPTYKLQLPIRKTVSERKKIRRLLRAMLPMTGDQIQDQEEKNLAR